MTTTQTDIRLHPAAPRGDVNGVSGLSRNPNTALKRALLATTGWADAVTAVNAVCEYEATLRANTDLRAPLLEQLANEARTGVIVTDFNRLAADSAAMLAGRAATIEATSQVKSQLTSELDMLVRTHLDGVRRHLGSALAEVVAEATKHLDDLRTAPDAQAVLAGAPQEAYERATELPKRYELIREAQRKVDRAGISDLPTRYSTISLIENILEVWPLAGYAFANVDLSDDDGSEVSLSAPWPNPSDARAFLVWAAGSSARLWVPSESELATSARALVDAELTARRSTPEEQRRVLRRRIAGAPTQSVITR